VEILFSVKNEAEKEGPKPAGKYGPFMSPPLTGGEKGEGDTLEYQYPHQTSPIEGEG